MKLRLVPLLTANLGLIIALVSPTLAQVNLGQIGRMPLTPTNTILQAQTQDIETLRQQAIQYSQQRKPQQAIETFQQVLKLAQQKGDKVSEAFAYVGLGRNYNNIGQPKLALESYDQALSIFQEIKDRRGEAVTLNNIGLVYDNIGKPEEALKYYNQALPITREVGDRNVEATTLHNIATVYNKIGKPEEALKYYNQALPIRREVGDLSGEATTLNNIGLVYNSIGKSEEALKYYNQALPIFRKVGDRTGEATTLNNIGGVYGDIGKLEEALKYYNQALPISREIGDLRGQAGTLNNIGGVYGDRGKLEAALKYYNQALPISREVGDRSVEATTLNNIGGVYGDRGKPEEALKYYNQALPISREVGNRSGEATTLNNIGGVYRDTNQPDKAIANLEASINITLDIRKELSRNNRKAFIEAKNGTAIVLVDLLIKQNQPQKAYQWANLVTTFNLADYTRLINAKVANAEAQKEIDQWNEINQQLTFLLNQQEDNNRQGKYSIELAKRINEIQAQANTKAEDISKKYSEVAELFETSPTDIKKLQENLPKNTVVIQPFLLTGLKNVPNTIALFVLTQDKLTVIQKPLPKNLNFDELVTNFRQQLETISSYTDTSTQLYDLLIRPVEEKFTIPPNYQLAIIATGKLRNIPFEALEDSQTDKFLLEKYPVFYLTRLSKTQNLLAKNSQQKTYLNALIIANPRPTKEELNGTETEADYIKQNLPGSQDYRHEKATIETFKNQALGFSILHLGTHGCFIPQGCPELKMDANTILFANDKKYPIADAALLGLTKTEILVLSACQTAQITDNLEDVGLSGLAYVWERAGAKTTLASLWNAADNESSEIMTKFYANLKQGMSKAQAMQKAKLTLINKHPFLWSPFILIGDGQ